MKVAGNSSRDFLSPAMSRKAFYSSFLIALSGACAGCATGPPEMKPMGKAVVRVIPELNPTQATVQLANEVAIVLPAPQSGYEWQIVQHNTATLRQLTEIVPTNDGTGEYSVSFMTLRLTQGESGSRGATRLLFALVPTDNKTGAQPADIRDIQITVE
jgi:hypothetical protein